MNEEKSSFIKGINEQHPAAYHQLYNEYYKALVLYAINFLSSQQAAEDIVQDLFATMWEKKMRFLSLPSFRTYLYNSIRNASLNYLDVYKRQLCVLCGEKKSARFETHIQSFH